MESTLGFQRDSLRLISLNILITEETSMKTSK